MSMMPWVTTPGVTALYQDRDEASAAAERFLSGSQGSVIRYLGVEGHTGPFVAMVRAAGEADELAPLAGDCVGVYASLFRLVRSHRAFAPVGEPTPGVSATFGMVRRPDLTHEQADTHWRDTHAPLALKHHVGMSGYTQCSFVMPLTAGSPAFDGVALCHFGTIEDLKERFFDGPDGVKAIREDVAKFSDGAASSSLHTIETILRV